MRKSLLLKVEANIPDTGFGRFNGEEGLKEWVRLKTITWKD